MGWGEDQLESGLHFVWDENSRDSGGPGPEMGRSQGDTEGPFDYLKRALLGGEPRAKLETEA